jgi:hypothetical protein
MTALPDGWTEDRDGTERIRTLMERPGALRVVGAFHHRDGRVAILTRDNIGEPSAHDWRWHLSVRQTADGGRVADWNEIANTAHDLRPSVGFVLSVPPRSLWMSVHDHVLHLEEVKDANLEAQWVANRGDGVIR